MPSPALSTTNRIQSIDTLRGLVMLIMALDHVRDFFHASAMLDEPTNLLTTTPYLFFTRWITHFCAPVFLFLSGMSAYLAGTKRTKAELSKFLITRGLWLIVVEVVVITFALTFNPFYNVIALQVIWAIGVSMVILGLLVRLSVTAVAVVGFAIFLGHNLFDYFPLTGNAAATTANLLLNVSHSLVPITSNHAVLVFYAAIPWSGAMMLGYAFAYYCTQKTAPASRAKVFFSTGLVATMFFIVVRYINAYGDPAPWSVQKSGIFTLLSFLNATKYPPSLMYYCMTLGPALMLLGLFERLQNSFTGILQVYGKVPFFYYVLHFYIIHGLCVIAFFATGHNSSQIVDPQTPFFFRPLHFGFHLWVVYAIWLFVIVLLYKPCKWFVQYKYLHKNWWLSYV